MAAPLGNKFWLARASCGRNPKFSDPDKLWDMCVEYFNWANENPLYEEKAFAFQGNITKTSVALARVMTLTSMCMFIGLSLDAWSQYRERPDFVGVCKEAEQVIREQKFAGASSGQFNPMIIARDLGLREQTAVDHSSADGSMSPISATMTPMEAAAAYQETIARENG